MPKRISPALIVGAGLIACTASVPAIAARPQALAKDGVAVPVERYEDCKATTSQARLDQPSQTVFVKGNALDNAVLKCLNQWADRHKFRVVLQPVIE